MSLRLLTGILFSVAIHVAAFSIKSRHNNREAIIEIDSGAVAVELTLMPSIETPPPAPPAPTPPPEEKEPVPETPEPVEPEDILPLTEPEIVVPAVLNEAVETPPEKPVEKTVEEPVAEKPVEALQPPGAGSIEQDGSLNENKGTFTDAEIQSQCTATYPAVSRKRGEEGSVMLAFTVSETGRVGDIQVVKSSGYKRLDTAAVKAIGNAKFTPAFKDGEPIRSELTQSFNFKLTDE